MAGEGQGAQGADDVLVVVVGVIVRLVGFVGGEELLNEMQQKESAHERNRDGASTEGHVMVAAVDLWQQVKADEAEQEAGRESKDEVEAVTRPQGDKTSDGGGAGRYEGEDDGREHDVTLGQMRTVIKMVW